MRPSILDLPQSCEDILALRRAIAQLAARCRVDLTDRTALRRVLDGDFCAGQSAQSDHQDLRDLSAMLTLLFRLEASSSEDLGITGLHRLWHQHGRMLARFRAGQASAGAGQQPLAAH
ncbi:MAG: hypothetical protein H6R17_2353 [Proteobacteria bacterium]|nr:hypothetical protein [Pseudomonadota bacterium]